MMYRKNEYKFYKFKTKTKKAKKKIIEYRLVIFLRVGYAKREGRWIGGRKWWAKKSFVNQRRYWKKNGCPKFLKLSF